MRLGYVWDCEYPWDVRTEKVCAALAAAGHDVHILARNRERAPLAEARAEGMVHRMAPLPWLGRRLDRATSFPAFFNPRWARHVLGVARRAGVELLAVRDLPLAPTALWAGRRLGIPVVIDMAENYPAMIRETWDAGRQGPLDILVRNPSAVEAVERWALPRADRVVVVVEESAARIRALGVRPERIAVVSNTPPLERVQAPPRPARDRAAPLELVYLGLMEVARGVADVLRAVRILRDRGEAVRLRLIGAGRDLPLFQSLAGELGLGPESVRFLGQLPHAEALRLTGEADAGVVPHHADDSWNTTIPNKLFDYMALGLPIVSSDAAPCARVLRETGAGVVFRSRDAASLADAVAPLREPALRARLGAAGRAAILARYHWERDARILVETLEAAAASGARR